MTVVNWVNIQAAWRMINEGGVDRIDGDGWKMYRVGDIIRIDTEVK